jgi:hypothetical protein
MAIDYAGRGSRRRMLLDNAKPEMGIIPARPFMDRLVTRAGLIAFPLF